MNSLLQTLSLSAIVFLTLIQRGNLRPPPCKDGNKFYEESVFDYFNCSICIEQNHYSNCDVCCSATVTDPTTSLSTSLTTPSVSLSGIKQPPSSEASEVVESDPKEVSMKAEELIIVGFFIGFLAVLAIAGLVTLLFGVKYYRKKKKQKKLGFSRSSSIKIGMQETQLSPSSPMVMGLTDVEPVPL